LNPKVMVRMERVLLRRSLVAVGVAAGLLGARLAEAGALHGRVVDSGHAVVGATATVAPYASAFDLSRRDARGEPGPAPLGQASAGADGRFTVTLPPGSALVQLSVEAPGFVAVRLVSAVDAGATTDVGDVALHEAATLAGRVVDGTGKGVSGASVRLEPPDGGRPNALPESREARTGADGAFLFDGAAVSGNRIDVGRDGFGSVSVGGLRGGGAPVTIALGPAATVSGAVKKADGRTPAAGVLVRFESGGRSRWIETAADGSFRIPDASAGAGRIEADGGPQGRTETRATAPATAVLLVLDPPTRIFGRVVNARTRHPLAGVRVIATGGHSTSMATSGPDGRYQIDGLAMQTCVLSVDDPRFVRYARGRVRPNPGRPFSADIPLTPGASLSGRVVDEQTKPVAGAEVRLSSGGGRRLGPRFRRPRGQGEGNPVRTATDGTFKMERLPSGSNMRLTVTHPDFVEGDVAGITLTGGTAKTGLSVVLRRGLEMAGTVRDGQGHPVVGAELRLRPAPSEGRAGGRFAFGSGPGPGDDHFEATSGADGRFRIAGLEAGAYALEAHRDGLADAHIDVVRIDPEAVTPVVDVWMLPGAAVRGAVRRPDGSGARGFIVLAQAGGSRGFPFGPGARRPEATSDDGLFSIEGLQAGETYTLTVLGGGGLPQEHPGILAPAEGVDIAVGGTGQIAGHVVDAQTRKPILGFHATYEGERGAGGFGRGPGGRGGFGGRIPPADDGGDDEDTPPPATDGSFLVKDVPPGSWTVVVEADGYETARVSHIEVKEGETTPDVDFRIDRGLVLSGRAVEAGTGQPIPGVSITAVRAAGGGPGGFGQAAAVTDADGRFDVAGLALGTYRVQARHPDYADASQLVDVQQQNAAVEIQLSGGGTLAGLVVSPSGVPVPGASVAVRAGGGGRFGGGGSPSTLSDESGAFHVDRLAPGVYQVSASLGGASSAPQEVPLLAGQSRSDVRVVLGGGATLKGQISGLGVDLRGSVNVTASGPQEFFAGARPTADGAFTLSGLPEGSTHLRATAGNPATGTRTASADVEIAEAQTEADVDIAFTDGFSLSGTVSRSGQPVSGVAVMARVAGQGPSGTARTDEGGSYRVVGLGAATYSVEASPPSGASRRQTVEISGDQTLDFSLPPAGISGVVVETGSGRPLAGASVGADGGSASASREARAVTDSNGLFTIDGLDPQPYSLTASLAEYAYDRRTVDAGADGSDSLRIELKPANGLDIRALDAASGAPLGSLLAEVRDPSGTALPGAPIRLDGDGRGEVPSLSPGSYQIHFVPFGYRLAPLTLSVTVPSPALDLPFTPGGSVTVTVGTETAGGAPAPQGRLVDAYGFPVPVTFGRSGWFPLTVGDHPIQNVPPGACIFEVDRGSGSPTRITVQVQSGPVPAVVTLK
jgi:protocatechuate 3,4-dioxygenase beta subunit